MANPHYRHTQVGWVIIGCLAPVTLLLAPMLLRTGSNIGLVLFLAVAAIVVALFGALTVSVGETHLEARFGIGLIRKRVPLDRIRSYASVSSPWYYGWGIRFIPGGTLYNVSGFQSVELTLHDGGRIRIGTDEPEALVHALTRKLGAPPPLSPEETARVRSRSKRFTIAAVAISSLISLAVGVMLYLEKQPPSVRIDAGVFTVRGAIYSAEVPLNDVSGLSLENSLPRIQSRTNGFALGRTRRGNFRVEGLGQGKLFIEAGAPPFVVLRTPDSFVIVNFDDPEQTRALYEDLRVALPAP